MLCFAVLSVYATSLGAAGEAPADRSKPLEYAELSRLRRNSGASGRDQINDTGIETRSKSEEELIDEENRATIASMSASEVAVAQVELMNRLKPDVIEMLRKRSQKKNSKEGKGAEKEVDARPVAMNVVVESDSSPERKEAGKGSNTHEISESGEAPVGALKNQEENHAPAPQLDSVPLTVPALGWSKSWIERVEAVRLYRFDMQGHLVAIDEASIQNTSGKLHLLLTLFQSFDWHYRYFISFGLCLGCIRKQRPSLDVQ